MDLLALKRLVRKMSDQEPLTLRETHLRLVLPEVGAHPDVDCYFRNLLVPNSYDASDVYVNGFFDFRPDEPPDSIIGQYGFVSLGGISVSGNSLVVDVRTGAVHYSDHESFSDASDEISCPPPLSRLKSGEWSFVSGYSRENVLRALPTIDENIISFLVRCLTGEIQPLIDEIM